MSKILDLTGQQFGNWTVIGLDTLKTKTGTHWLCRCECGDVHSRATGNLRSGKTKKCKKCNGNTFQDLTGKTFGNWQVKELINRKERTWLCVCKCGREYTVRNHNLTLGKSTQCTNCSGWQGYEDISKTLYNVWMKSGIKRGLEWSLQIEDIWALYIQQDRKCALSGLPIKFSRNPHTCAKNQTASLDRIDNNKGYTKDNVQLVHKAINFMKHTNTQDDFIIFCNMIAETHPRTVDRENFIYNKGVYE